MQRQTVTLDVPAEAAYARSVRMLAANLGVVCALSVDDVDDLRMAAEEGFVYACATKPRTCAVSFVLDDGTIEMDFSLGSADAQASEQDGDDSLAYVDLLLSAICDEHEVDEGAGTLRLVKHVGTDQNAER